MGGAPRDANPMMRVVLHSSEMLLDVGAGPPPTAHSHASGRGKRNQSLERMEKGLVPLGGAPREQHRSPRRSQLAPVRGLPAEDERLAHPIFGAAGDGEDDAEPLPDPVESSAIGRCPNSTTGGDLHPTAQ